MLTARDAIDDRVVGLDVGADDYLVKPFALRDNCRPAYEPCSAGSVIRMVTLRCCGSQTWCSTRSPTRSIVASVWWSSPRRSSFCSSWFLKHPRQVLTRSTIFENVWGYDFGPTSNALGVYIGYLRRKTEEGDETRLLHTVRGIGYVLRD